MKGGIPLGIGCSRLAFDVLQAYDMGQVTMSIMFAAADLDDWLHQYSHHRYHTAIDGTPISRVNNLRDQYT